MKVPGEAEFPIGDIQHQAQWVAQTKSSRFQMGTKATRELHPKLRQLGFKTTQEALRYDTTAGQMTEMQLFQQGFPISPSGWIASRPALCRRRRRGRQGWSAIS